ncbi:hypothetical protein C1X61_17950 [Pseudomonas sp. FW215-T2]|nr:hypothetical protein C1X61_17950 [Pseudomonas sp. FW215-T2]PNB35732.1 hypothetical protein C1X63_20875 [Pseudomonas sp. FW305-131]
MGLILMIYCLWRPLREQARSHMGSVNDTDQLWERACSRRPQRGLTARLCLPQHRRRQQLLGVRMLR